MESEKYSTENGNVIQSVSNQLNRTKKFSKKSIVIGITGLCFVSAVGGGMATIAFAPSYYHNLKTPTSMVATTTMSRSSIPSAIKLGTDQTGNYPTEQIAQQVGPAVVGIANYQSPQNSFGDSNPQEVDSGSGFIIDAHKGYIVTNNHVIDGAQKIMVNLSDGRNVQAKLIGADPHTDLAVLQISADKLTQVNLGDSTKIQVGEPVVAIGNPGGIQFARSETAGIISATNRQLDITGEDSFNLIQTDAAINPGNSGGPLVDYSGNVIGINSAKFAQSGFEGMGFAIPISDALPTIEQLIKTGAAQHPALMVSINDQYDNYAQYNNLPQGAYISSVSPGGPAAKAGLQTGDIITKINNQEVQNSADLVHDLYQYQVGDAVTVTYIRNGQTNQVQVTLGEISSNQ
ncbi:trypsin-like serine protease with C-terminal PDZ domain [Desulfosporosinus acidiphilus SJ4]|uniref:Trypsin-like serine protease with C-terminal PDZ domain n=1 Tax=Desulfosporosinus acidiphilus (strain DSM 22704 / JCM 16185 / SJ4) TaxID=646529 RepID=I4D2D7_DESAJ|nr:trypsin-like peptidase domain-containing protein [Desulfosporosinus acidiphilus]AFM39961.1 trypsin-like serine protease with C-terminal PDZ domain [Desulfosporosinus acidiphilus SJ4]